MTTLFISDLHLEADRPEIGDQTQLPAGSGDRIMVNHDDLDLELGIGEAFYQYFAACPRPLDGGCSTVGCSVFMWDDVAHFPGGGMAPVWDQWVFLYDTGDIVTIDEDGFVYAQTRVAPSASITIVFFSHHSQLCGFLF